METRNTTSQFFRLIFRQDKEVCKLYTMSLCLMVSMIGFPGVSIALDLSNEPMETKVQSAPANIMFVLDNSGSMDWEYATNSSNGTFRPSTTTYEYLYNISDNNFATWSSNGTVLTGGNRGYWKSQWSGYNRLYYNPSSTYKPWPDKSNIMLAGLRSVRSNPQNATPTIDLTAQYVSLSGVNISLLHYYTWFDQNTDDIINDGEIYLINISWTDADSDGDVEVSELNRNYYQVLDADNDDKVEAGDLVGPLAVAAIPDAIKATRSLEDGGTQVMTVDEEARNLANWFGFYRKRSMTAKYAISSAISDFNYVNVGFYTINDNGDNARLPVQPVHVDSESITMDNRDVTFTRSNNWTESSHNGEYLDSSLYSLTNGSWARWTPNISDSGQYRVYAWWVDSNGGRDTNACYSVNHSGGNTGCIRINQTENVSEFRLLGTYTFDEGSDGYAQVERNAPNGTTSADAIMFEPVTGGVTVDATSGLRSSLYGVVSNNSTPLRTAFNNVGRYFDVEDTGGFAGTPYCSEEDGGACQQAFAIVMTDGYYNDNVATIGNTDIGMVAPYGDTYSNTLADVAMKFYNADLADNLPNQLSASNVDSVMSQHLVTYTVAFGVEGTISLDDLDQDGTADSAECNYADDPYFLNNCTPEPTWPDPDDGNQEKIDDLLHASVNGRGEYFSAASPEALVDSLKKITQDINERKGSGSSVAVNGDMLIDGTTVYHATYESGVWSGNVYAYLIDKTTGLILNGDGQEVWDASSQLESKLWSDRLIISSNGEKTGTAFDYNALTSLQKIVLGSASLVDYVKGDEMVDARVRDKKLGDIVHSSPLVSGTVTSASTTDNIDNDNDGLVDEVGESVGGTIFVGANDGMLHAFNAQNGKERFAYIPSMLFGHLEDLTDLNYQHRFYVDGSLYSKNVTFAAGNRSADNRDNDGDGTIDEADEDFSDGVDNDGDGHVDETTEKASINMLVGGLGRGGKGYFALDITLADQVSTTSNINSVASMVKWEYPRRYFDGIDNDSDGRVDESDEADLAAGYVYNFSGDQRADGVDNDGDGFQDTDTGEIVDGFNEDYSDGIDNDWDGEVDEKGEKAIFFSANSDNIDNDLDGTVDETGELALVYRDDDLGYSYSDPFIVRGYHNSNNNSKTDHPWMVIFGNGYDSVNGHAVLYILDALTGEVIRKIDTGVGGNNGLSTPSVVDIDDDDRADFVYAGDLLGNLWKFDLKSNNPSNWGVAHKDSSDVVQPMFTAPGQAITSKPDVLFHCSEHGYVVTFGTGKFLGEADRTNGATQTVFGIWDYGDRTDMLEYPGSWERSSNTLSNITGVKLQKQTLVNEQYSTDDGSYLRAITAHEPHWYLVDDETSGQKPNPGSISAYATDSIDNDNDGRVDETSECDVWNPDTLTCIGHVEADSEDVGHVGWYFDLPGIGSIDGIDNDGDTVVDEAGEQSSNASERIVKDVLVRDGRLIFLSFIPDDSPCSGGGMSIFHEIDVCTGGRVHDPVFDITGPPTIGPEDVIIIDGPLEVPPSGQGNPGLVDLGSIVQKDEDIEIKITSDSKGGIGVIFEKAEQTGAYYWREVNN